MDEPVVWPPAEVVVRSCPLCARTWVELGEYEYGAACANREQHDEYHHRQRFVAAAAYEPLELVPRS